MPTVSEWAERLPDAPAVISPSGDRTFSELDRNANRLVRALRRRGLTEGDAVALISGNRSEFVEVVHACQRGGFRLTPINWHLTGDEAGYIASDCEAKAVIADLPRAEMAREAQATAPLCDVAIVIGGTADGMDTYEAALAAESDEAVEETTLGTTMLYTSGTTGRPKGVHRPPAAERGAMINLFGYDENGGDRHLVTGPLYHAAPLAFSLAMPLAWGAAAVL